MADRSRFTTEKVTVGTGAATDDCQAIAANSQGLTGKSSFSLLLSKLLIGSN